MRRRVKTAQGVSRSGIPVRFDEFEPDSWPGETDWERYLVWDDERRKWADDNLLGGSEDLPLYVGYAPDAPFDPDLI